MQLSKPELTAFRIKNKNHFFEVFWTLKVTSPTAPWAAGGGCGPSETAAGLLKTRRDRRDLAGQLSASGHGPSSHRPSAPCTQRARPTPPTASATPTLTTRPPGPGSGSIRPKTTNKEEARVRLRGPPPQVPTPLGGSWSPTRANSYPGLDAVSAPRPGSRWCTAASPARTVTKEQGIRVGRGESSEPREPRLCARPAARTRPLPAHHSAPRASTVRGAAEPSRRAASAPESPWPHSPGRGGESARCASLPRAGRGWSR